MFYFLNNLYVRILLWGFFAMFARDANSQPAVESHQIDVTFNKTSSIIFPVVIKSVDRGSRDILAQKAKGVGNVLQLKAGKENFPETNLTVITADGAMHQFKVTYTNEPTNLAIIVEDSSQVATDNKPVIFQTEMTEDAMNNYASTIQQAKRTIRFIGKSDFKVSFAFHGIYIKDNVMFFQLKAKNNSNIPYDIDFLRFYIRDKTKVKRTASQEIQIRPLYVHGDNKSIGAQSEIDLVYMVEKFTIPDAKDLHIEMFERNGGRNFNLTVKNKTIVKAKPLL